MPPRANGSRGTGETGGPGVKQPAIEAHGLTKRFGSFTAVDGVSFFVERGSIFGLLGANGAGKSTTIRMLCGLLLPTSGTARVAGYRVNEQPEQIKQNIGYMSQRFSLYTDLTVRENIRFFGGIYGLAADQIREREAWTLEMAGLQGREESITAELAGGFKQRLALGCAVLHAPPVVFLDEPTAGVDPLSRRRFWELINLLAEGGTTVLVTTHYLDEAEYCNHLLLIHAGHIVAEGTPRQMKDSTLQAATLEVACSPCIAALGLLKSQPWVRHASVFGSSLHIQTDTSLDRREAEERITDLLSANRIELNRIDTIVPSLEDIFIQTIESQATGAQS